MPDITVTLSEQSMAAASAVVAKMGLSLPQALSLEVDRIAAEMSFEIPHIPNQKTADALDRSERGEGVYTAKDEDDFYKQLGIPEWRSHI